MSSKYLSNLSDKEYMDLSKKLHTMQNGICFICQKEIDLDVHKNSTNIDHIVPLANGGKDSEDNFALTHESCNKSKQDADLRVARILAFLKEIQEKTYKTENSSASLRHILRAYNGGKYEFKYSLDSNMIKYSFADIGDNTIYSAQVYTDKLSGEKNAFLEIPLEYIHHDELINPRGLNNSISLLIKEFYKKNPQLHLSLARLDENKIKIFDGQHKAVAQILLGMKKVLLRVFIEPDVDRLIETNTNAGSKLRQIAFDKSIMRQLHNTLYGERIRKYQSDHNLSIDNFSFSEQQLVDYFKGEVNIKKYIIDSIKNSITHSMDNKLKEYIDFEGKAKELPISYSSFEKTFLTIFLNSKLILATPIDYKDDEGTNPRQLELNQLVKLLNILAEEIYIGKFTPDVGVYRIEQRIIDHKDRDITDDHLIAYRMSKEEVMFNWQLYLQKVIESYFSNTGKMYDRDKLFQSEFPDQIWINIRNFIKNLKALPLWKDRGMAATVFSGKNTYNYWKTIFETGNTPDNAIVLVKPLNYVEMIKGV